MLRIHLYGFQILYRVKQCTCQHVNYSRYFPWFKLLWSHDILIIIIIKSCWQYRFPWLSLIIHPYYPSLLADPLDCIQCLHRGDVSLRWLANTDLSMCSSPWENIVYEFVLTSTAAVPSMSCSSWLIFEIVGKWPYSCCFVGCCFQDLFKTECSILG